MTYSLMPKIGAMQTKFIELPCKKLRGIARIKAGYYFGKDSRFLAEFRCKQAEDCGISRSPFSTTFNYTVHCPIYIALASKMNDKDRIGEKGNKQGLMNHEPNKKGGA